MIAAVARALRTARRVAVLTGAGMSAESGLPTYRGIGGFHRAAGSNNVVELHGNLRQLYCCDGLVRPDVVLFGELLPEEAVATYERELDHGFDVMFAIGTTAAFPYVHAPMATAGARGCVTVEINPDVTPLSHQVHYCIRSGALAALLGVDAALQRT